MSQMFKPKTYNDWLNELNFSVKEDDMIVAATNAGKLAADKNAARHDIALVLARKYQAEMRKNGKNGMVARDINERYEHVSQNLFKSKFDSLLAYVVKNEPEFDIRSTGEQAGKTTLGFVKATVTKDPRKGYDRTPLGFMRKPEGRVDPEGNIEPGLGFLGSN